MVHFIFGGVAIEPSGVRQWQSAELISSVVYFDAKFPRLPIYSKVGDLIGRGNVRFCLGVAWDAGRSQSERSDFWNLHATYEAVQQ